MGRSGKKSQAPAQADLFGFATQNVHEDPLGIPDGQTREKVRGIQPPPPHTTGQAHEPRPQAVEPPRAPRPHHLVVDSLADVAKHERDLGPRLTWARFAVAKVAGPSLGDASAPLAARAKAFVERCRVFREHMEPGR